MTTAGRLRVADDEAAKWERPKRGWRGAHPVAPSVLCSSAAHETRGTRARARAGGLGSKRAP